ncbi:hypothetical protein Meth11DRAFT_1268 [Methylophilaceae bacterium 11]|uniref:hypothetical protein n=1 Tax=unclassified Methylotenera TaxID=2643294 RepID=UPI00035F9B65|nr:MULTISPECIES: hypothetical protein [unclassified Methylotenera]EUJ10449.1 hypothetical protein Meth11DRAFT_1268 [Methylophilaceae bacterium 11]
MALNNTRWVTLAVAICFAILQALQPFIHAHLDTEHPIQHTGFHVGDEHEEAYSVEHSADHAVSNIPHATHTISVASGIKQDVDVKLLINILAVVFSVCFLLKLQATQKLNPALLSNPKESLKRRLPAARAPPQR